VCAVPVEFMTLSLLTALCALSSPSVASSAVARCRCMSMTSRRSLATQAVAAAATLVCAPRSSLALNLELLVGRLDAEAKYRTAADFSSVVEVRPISGPTVSALVVVDAGNAGDFEYVWLKDELKNKVISVRSSGSPSMMIKVPVPRGTIVRPLAYSKETGLYVGDPMEVRVGGYRPDVLYEGRPDGPKTVRGEYLYGK